MKKYLALLCAALLCAGCLAFAACSGGTSGSAASSNGSAAASSAASSQAADPAASFVGDWKIVGATTQGITVAGDFSQFLGDEANMTINLKEGGTGSAVVNEETQEITWKVENDTTVSMTANGETLTGVLEDGIMKIEMQDSEFTGEMLLSKDGSTPVVKEISAEGAQSITSEDALVGDWKLSGMNIAGMTAYGDADQLSQLAGGTDTTMTIEKGGSGTLMGEQVEWSVSADGAVVSMSGMDIPVKSFDGGLMIDLSDVLGTTMIMTFSK